MITLLTVITRNNQRSWIVPLHDTNCFRTFSFALGMGCIKALEHSETDTKEPIEKKTSYNLVSLVCITYLYLVDMVLEELDLLLQIIMKCYCYTIIILPFTSM